VYSFDDFVLSRTEANMAKNRPKPARNPANTPKGLSKYQLKQLSSGSVTPKETVLPTGVAIDQKTSPKAESLKSVISLPVPLERDLTRGGPLYTRAPEGFFEGRICRLNKREGVGWITPTHDALGEPVTFSKDVFLNSFDYLRRKQPVVYRLQTPDVKVACEVAHLERID
jgi:hypothetical protein